MLITVGIFISISQNWMGGVNYYKNLLQSISKIDQSDFKIVVFVSSNIDKELLGEVLPNMSALQVVYTSFLKIRHLLWILRELWRKYFKSDVFIWPLLRIYGIQIISHSDFYSAPRGVKIANWIPDFQHLRLPEMFSADEIIRRSENYYNLSKASDLIFLSSEDAKKDFLSLYPNFKNKIRVLRFAVPTPKKYWMLNDDDKVKLFEKYKLFSKYIYVPNQFWRHKNHQLIIDAMIILKKRGVNVNLVFSGATHDYRDPKYFQELARIINGNDLYKNIKILGIVPSEDVYALIKFSQIVVNPSRFEGWSTVVEECKSVGKNMILSDIAVHREQLPEANFFDVEDSNKLAELLEISWGKFNSNERLLNKNLNNDSEISKYGMAFLDAIKSII